jgi:hypothetical protein
MSDPDVVAMADSFERLINIARTIEFDLLHGRVETVAQLLIESHFLSAMRNV